MSKRFPETNPPSRGPKLAAPPRSNRERLRNSFRCDRFLGMAVATAAKVRALRRDFKTGAAVADLLGVNRSQVTRWLRGAGIDPLNAERIDLLEMVWSNLLRLYEPAAARSWLFGLNPHLGDRRPIDVIRAGRAEELMRAIRAERAESFA
jgi:hypothetical protein